MRRNGIGICRRNPVCKAAYYAAYGRVNEEEISIRYAAWYEEHKEEKVASSAAYYELHKEEYAARDAVWTRANPEKKRAAISRRRAKLKVGMDKLDRALSADYRIAIKNDVCFYCKVRPGEHDEHYIPLARGGTDHWWNLVRACAPCNLRKHAKNGDEFLLI
jgi:5-methylcytosine-specific restriction endonuclease McrA